jgi:hypothetical protein
VKPRVDLFVLGVFRMCIFPDAVCLPDFQHGIGYAYSVAVNHAPANLHALTGNIRAGEFVGFQPVAANGKERSNGL